MSDANSSHPSDSSGDPPRLMRAPPEPAGIDPGLEEAAGPGLEDLAAAIRRHRWAAVVTFVIAAAVGGAVVAYMPRVYSCRPAVLQVVSNAQRLATLNDVLEASGVSRPQFETLISLVRLAPVMQKARSRVLDGDKFTYPDFVDAVELRADGGSNLVRLSFKSSDPERNAEAANAIAETFMESVDTRRDERTGRASSVFAEQRAKLEVQLDDAEAAISQFLADAGISDLQAEMERVNRRLVAAESNFDERQIALFGPEDTFNDIAAARAAGDLAAARVVRTNSDYQRIQSDVRDAIARRAQLLEQYVENSRQVVDATARIETLRAEAQRFAEAICEQQERSFTNGKRVLAILQEVREARRADDAKLAQLRSALSRLESARGRIASRLADLSAKADSIQSASGLDIESVVLWERAQPDFEPIRPKPVRDLGIVAFAALGLGVMMALLLHLLDNRVHSVKDATRAARLRALGMIPALEKRDGTPGLISLAHPRSAGAEAYRILRNVVSHAGREGRPPVMVMLTSTEKGEGKTTTAVNLAIASARAGKRTLLVDCDLRNPQLHVVLGLANETGLSDLLRNGAATAPAVATIDGVPLLEVITSGSAIADPSQALGSERMQIFLSKLKRDYDSVVIDSPPSGPVSDPALLAHQVDGVIVVVACGQTRRKALDYALDHLYSVGAPVLGFVFNKSPIDSVYHSYYE